MYAPEQGLFKTDLFIKQGPPGSGYKAFLRASGGNELTAGLGEPPSFPQPGRVAPSDYGTALFNWVFRDEFRRGLEMLHGLSYRSLDELPSMRLQLRLEPQSPLSEICWETMSASPDQPPLGITTAFSRFVHEQTPGRPPVWEKPVRILLIVSNPEGLQRFDLESVDQNLEKGVLKVAERQLEGRISVKRLLRPRLQDIRNEERGGYHITHLLAHADTDANQGGVLLADDAGKAVSVGLPEIADAIASPSDTKAPYLVFLALPINGEAPHGRVLMRLASQLIRSGVQSVVVLQAPIEPEPLTLCMDRFYSVLLDTGAVDVALTEARKHMFHQAKEQWDWVWPVLFTRTIDSGFQQRLPESLAATVDAITFA